MEREFAWPEGHWNLPIKVPFSHGVRAGQLIFVGGQVAYDKEANLLHSGDIVAQTRIAMDNVQKVLQEFGAGMNDIVKLQTFFVSTGTREEWKRCAEIRFSYFDYPGPASTAIPVPALGIPGLMVEIDAIAVLSE